MFRFRCRCRPWKSTLDSITSEGLTSNLPYVDLCNEFPLDIWAPFASKGLKRQSREGVRWMAEPIAILRKSYPSVDYTFSFTSEYETWRQQDVSSSTFWNCTYGYVFGLLRTGGLPLREV